MNISMTLCDFCLTPMKHHESTHSGRSDAGGEIHTCKDSKCRADAKEYFDKLRSVWLERDSWERSISQKYKHEIAELNKTLSELYVKKNKELNDKTQDFILTPLQEKHGQNSSCVKVLGVDLKHEQD